MIVIGMTRAAMATMIHLIEMSISSRVRAARPASPLAEASRIGHCPDLLLLIAEIADDRLRKTHKERHRILENLQALFVFEHLQEGAQSQRAENVLGSVRCPLLARFHDLGAGRAFWKR